MSKLGGFGHAGRGAMLAGFLGLGVTAAHAAPLIDVQFTQTGSPAYSGAAVLGASGDYWNTFSGPSVFGGPSSVSGSGALKDAAGASTGISLNYSATGFFDATTNAPFFGGTQYANLLDAYVLSYADTPTTSAAPGTVTLSGLTADGNYNLVLYSAGNSSGRQTNFLVNGVTQSVTANAGTTLTAGTNYTDFAATANAAGQLTITFYGTISNTSDGEADLNGLQLQAAPPSPPPQTAPEPASLLLLGSGAFFTLVARRRASRAAQRA